MPIERKPSRETPAPPGKIDFACGAATALIYGPLTSQVVGDPTTRVGAYALVTGVTLHFLQRGVRGLVGERKGRPKPAKEESGTRRVSRRDKAAKESQLPYDVEGAAVEVDDVEITPKGSPVAEPRREVTDVYTGDDMREDEQSPLDPHLPEAESEQDLTAVHKDDVREEGQSPQDPPPPVAKAKRIVEPKEEVVVDSPDEEDIPPPDAPQASTEGKGKGAQGPGSADRQGAGENVIDEIRKLVGGLDTKLEKSVEEKFRQFKEEIAGQTPTDGYPSVPRKDTPKDRERARRPNRLKEDEGSFSEEKVKKVAKQLFLACPGIEDMDVVDSYDKVADHCDLNIAEAIIMRKQCQEYWDEWGELRG